MLCSLYCATSLQVHKYCMLDIVDVFVHVDIIRGTIKKKDCKEFYIDEDTKNSSSYQTLLDFVINSIAKFKKDRNIRRQLPIGFTFPFPMKHESLTRGRLIRWTRDFKGTGAEGKDVVQLLEEAASRRGVSIHQTSRLHACMLAIANKPNGLYTCKGKDNNYMREGRGV